MVRRKESALKYALFRTSIKGKKSLQSKHFTKSNALKAKKRAEGANPQRKPFTIRKIK